MRLLLDNISVSFGEKEVLSNVSFEVNSKDKIAIVGRNGSGKTTLIKVITGEQEIDTTIGISSSSKIQKSGNFQIGFLKQIAFDDENITFEEELLKAYKDILGIKAKITSIEKKMESECTEQDILTHEKLITKFNNMGGHEYQKEYNTAIKKFGFTEEDKYKKLSEFSGGEKTKIALMKLLLSKPDLLILDEPTNHLDISSIEWLEDYLLSYEKAVIVVSHDRAFMDKFVNVVYEIEYGKIAKYIGNYSKFITEKAFLYEKQLKDYKQKTSEKQRLQDLADRFRYKATKAKMAQSKLKQIDKMGEIEKPNVSNTKVFSFDISPKIESYDDVLSLHSVEFGYNEPLYKISLKIQRGDRIGIVGGNGLGKSTLIRTIIGKIPSLKGSIKWGENVIVGYFDQQSSSSDNRDITVLDSYMEAYPDEDTLEARNTLGAFCFSGDDVFKSLLDLSGGERVRLELCKILKNRPNLLILDEPTNHMDIVGREALEKMLEKYTGTIIFVSHDRYFTERIATSLIVFDENGCNYYRDTKYSDYEKQRKARLESVCSIVQNPLPKPKELKQEKLKNNTYLQNKEKARNLAKQKKIEKQISELESEINELNGMLTDESVYSNYSKVLEIEEDIKTKTNLIDELTLAWLDLEGESE